MSLFDYGVEIADLHILYFRGGNMKRRQINSEIGQPHHATETGSVSRHRDICSSNTARVFRRDTRYMIACREILAPPPSTKSQRDAATKSSGREHDDIGVSVGMSKRTGSEKMRMRS